LSRQTFLGGDEATNNIVLACRAVMREIDTMGGQCDWGKMACALGGIDVRGADAATVRAARLVKRDIERHCDKVADGDYGDFDGLERADARMRGRVRAACARIARGAGE